MIHCYCESSAMDPYSPVYSPVNTEEAEICLLSLEPGQFDDPIVVVLSTFSLKDAPRLPYWALSYVWGQEASSIHATANGHPVPITANLDSALRHLRQEHQPLAMWVDALCINQDNVDERITRFGSWPKSTRKHAASLSGWDHPPVQSTSCSIPLGSER
jgi:hypothetical protein